MEKLLNRLRAGGSIAWNIVVGIGMVLAAFVILCALKLTCGEEDLGNDGDY